MRLTPTCLTEQTDEAGTNDGKSEVGSRQLHELTFRST